MLVTFANPSAAAAARPDAVGSRRGPAAGPSGGGASVVLAGPARQVGVSARYTPPVDAPVVDGFRPPTTPYGSGNRGWEYATPPGTTVSAAGAGEVTFAGPVGGEIAVTVLHADGLRTSYSYLASTTVRIGDIVARGDPLGTTGHRFHFGVRRGDTYLDPASLFAPVRGRPRLVPL